MKLKFIKLRILIPDLLPDVRIYLMSEAIRYTLAGLEFLHKVYVCRNIKGFSLNPRH